MTTFGLIHGAGHRAWCWERLIPELERRGHRAVAVDPPCDDPAATTMDNASVSSRSNCPAATSRCSASPPAWPAPSPIDQPRRPKGRAEMPFATAVRVNLASQ